MENYLKEITKKAGRGYLGDNRSRAVKNINKSIEMGLKLVLCESGYVYTTKKGYDYNIKVVLGVKASRWLIKDRRVSAYNILLLIGRFLQRQDVQTEIRKKIKHPVNCSKCSGKGIIPHFMYYAEGVCFDCGGSGLKFDL